MWYLYISMKVRFVDSSVIFKYMIIAVFMYEYDVIKCEFLCLEIP